MAREDSAEWALQHVRFDDRLATLLVQPAADPSAKAALWVQLADILCQAHGSLTAAQLEAGFERLRQWRDFVPAERRRATSLSLSYYPVDGEMVDLFAQDAPQIAAPMLSRAQLADEDWIQMIPFWPATSRALLRERRDLPAETQRLLGAYGTVDFALPGGVGDAVDEQAPIQIRDLVARIEAYRRDHQPHRSGERPPERIAQFRFESGGDGIINWIEGAPRGALIGISLADMAVPGGFGVDGHAAGACRQRTPFRDAHLEVAGIGEVAGTWLISANPLFNPDDGRFIGYRGIAKRPDTSRSGPPPRLLGGALAADSVRQLAHELRTPLNAIKGFGELIESRLMGPVAEHYRAIAHKIVRDAANLTSVIDDLDSAARLETGDWPQSSHLDAGVDLAELLEAVAVDLRPLSDDQGIRLKVSLGRHLPRARMDDATGRRLLGRLVAAAIELAEPGEELMLKLEATATGIAFMIDRPERIAAFSAEQIFATATVGDEGGHGELALGLGFTMRLIETLARRAGGSFDIAPDRFSLHLPAVTDSAGENKESG